MKLGSEIRRESRLLTRRKSIDLISIIDFSEISYCVSQRGGVPVPGIALRLDQADALEGAPADLPTLRESRLLSQSKQDLPHLRQ